MSAQSDNFHKFWNDNSPAPMENADFNKKISAFRDDVKKKDEILATKVLNAKTKRARDSGDEDDIEDEDDSSSAETLESDISKPKPVFKAKKRLLVLSDSDEDKARLPSLKSVKKIKSKAKHAAAALQSAGFRKNPILKKPNGSSSKKQKQNVVVLLDDDDERLNVQTIGSSNEEDSVLEDSDDDDNDDESDYDKRRKVAESEESDAETGQVGTLLQRCEKMSKDLRSVLTFLAKNGGDAEYCPDYKTGNDDDDNREVVIKDSKGRDVKPTFQLLTKESAKAMLAKRENSLSVRDARSSSTSSIASAVSSATSLDDNGDDEEVAADDESVVSLKMVVEDEKEWDRHICKDAADNDDDEVIAVESITSSSSSVQIVRPELELKPYQIMGVNWLSVLDWQGNNAVLADEMGLGKTIQALVFLRTLYENHSRKGPHLIVAPVSTLENWRREAHTWLPESFKVKLYHGSIPNREEMRRRAHRRPSEVNIWLTTYTYFERESCRDDRSFLYGLKFDTCVFDEAHAIKNIESSRYQTLSRLSSRRRVLLSGTPVQNRLDELFALLSFCLPKVFDRRREKIRERVFGEGSDPERVRKILQPFVLRRLKVQVLSSLAPKTEEVMFLQMTTEQDTMYKNMVNEVKQGLRSLLIKEKTSKKEQAQLAATSESAFIELRKAANHSLMLKRRFGQPGRELDKIATVLQCVGCFGKAATFKMVRDEISKYSDWALNACCVQYAARSPALEAMILPAEDVFDVSIKAQTLKTLILDLIAHGHRILLFSQWTSILDILEEVLNQIQVEYYRLDGGTVTSDRQQLVDGFNAGAVPVFLLSTRAGGLGLNLTSADTVILHDLDCNPSIDAQAQDRCHRFGQTKPVRVIKLVVRGTVDEALYRMQERKNGLNRAVLGDAPSGSVVSVVTSSPATVAAGAAAADGQSQEREDVLLPSMSDFENGVVHPGGAGSVDENGMALPDPDEKRIAAALLKESLNL